MSENLYVGLDIGTSKIAAVIGEESADGGLDFIGFGLEEAKGVRRGTIYNIPQAAEAIRRAVHQASRMANVEVKRVYVNVNDPQLGYRVSRGLATIRADGQDRTIRPEDIDRALETAQATKTDGGEIIHVIPLEYIVDDEEGITDPVGMTAAKLELKAILVLAQNRALSNLERAVEAAGLEVAGFVAGPYAAGLGVLTPEETESDTIVLDLGAGTTGVALFRKGRLARVHVLPLGGEHVSMDIAKLLKISFEEAERYKKKYGAALPDLADPELVLEITHGAQPVENVPATELAKIIRPRVREIFMLARKELERDAGPVETMANDVVLTGGGSLLKGTDRIARDEFKLPVRLGRPRDTRTLDKELAHPTFAVAVGMVRYAASEAAAKPKEPEPAYRPAPPPPPAKEARVSYASLLEGLKRFFKNLYERMF